MHFYRAINRERFKLLQRIVSAVLNYWQQSTRFPNTVTVNKDIQCDVAIIGGGFSGLNAAKTLSGAGVDCIILEAQTVGFGASGRNGGFCCYGGVKHEPYQLAKRYGVEEAHSIHRYQRDAIEYVDALLAELEIDDIQSNSKGEMCFALNQRQLTEIERIAQLNQSVCPELDYAILCSEALKERGYESNMVGAVQRNGSDFGLQPCRYLAALVNNLQDKGVPYYQNAMVNHIERTANGYQLRANGVIISAQKVIYATNAFSERAIDMNIMKAYSNIIVTEPLDDAILKAQGWVKDGLAYDAKHLLHYFRLLPDKRFLLGGRGVVNSDQGKLDAVKAELQGVLAARWPNFGHAKIDYCWGGPVAITPNRFPFVGQIGHNSYASFGYHGNGVALGSYSGHQLALLMLGKAHQIPNRLQQRVRYPLPWLRPLILKLLYGYYGYIDARS